jgi:hypothetical protein
MGALLPRGSIGISDLAENPEVIYGLNSLGQNIEPQRLSSLHLPRRYTAFAFSRCTRLVCAQGLGSQEAVTYATVDQSTRLSARAIGRVRLDAFGAAISGVDA